MALSFISERFGVVEWVIWETTCDPVKFVVSQHGVET